MRETSAALETLSDEHEGLLRQISVEGIGDIFLAVEGVEKHVRGFRETGNFPGFHGVCEGPVHAVPRAAADLSADAGQNWKRRVHQVVSPQRSDYLELFVVETGYTLFFGNSSSYRFVPEVRVGEEAFFIASVDPVAVFRSLDIHGQILHSTSPSLHLS